jgi:nicotinamidase-related amidase
VTEIKINRRTSALLVMDCQINIVNKLPPEEKARVLGNLAKAISAARKRTMPIIYVIAQFRKGYPEVSPRSTFFNTLKKNRVMMEGNPEVEICSEIRPQQEEVIIAKKRLSAFTGSELEIILRSKNIDTLVLSGISSLGVVESTARHAYDLDYQIFVLGDCCADKAAGAHEAALKWMLPRISTVCTSDDFVTAIAEN